MTNPSSLQARLDAMVTDARLERPSEFLNREDAYCIVSLDLLRKLDERDAPCTWEDDDDGIWKSSCGLVDWCFNDGGPVENNVKFCLGCGHPVVISAALKGGQP